MSIDFNTQVAGFDFETQGTEGEFALQPFRVLDKKAWVSAVAWTRGERTLGKLFPTPESHRPVLEAIIKENLYVCGWNVAFDAAWLIALGHEDLVFQIRWLDAMLLWKHWVVAPEGDDVPAAKRKSYSLEAAMHEFFPDEAGFKEFKNFQTQDPAELQQLLFRCKEDTRFAVRLAEWFWSNLTDEQRQAALIEAQCIPQVAKTYVMGIKSSAELAEALKFKLISDGEDAKAKLLALCPGTEFIEKMTPSQLKKLKAAHPEIDYVNLASPAQLATLLFETWGLPVQGVSKKTQAPSTDKYTLYELAFIDPRAKMLKEVREAKGNCTKYAEGTLKSLEYNGDGCVRPGARIFSTYCVPGDVEVFTRAGWVRLDMWGGGEIMQVHPHTRKMQFLSAECYAGPEESEWVRVKHSRLECDFTLGHTVPYLSQKSYNWMTMKASALSMRRVHIPLAGEVTNLSGSLTSVQMQVLAMFQADGYISRSTKAPSYKFTFVKSRKVERARRLLGLAGVEYREYVRKAYPERVEISIGTKQVPQWWRPEYKFLGPWVLDTTPIGLRDFVLELEQWDGSTHVDGGFRYASSIHSNVEWAATAAHLVGFRANIFGDKKNCHISFEIPVATIKPDKHVQKVECLQQTYCATTVTGFWLARSNGRIFVTGNSSRMTYSSSQKKKGDKDLGTTAVEYPTGIALHQWKRGKDFRRLIRPPEGYTLVELDFAGQEFGWMAVASGDETMLSLREPGEDAHAYMGAKIAQVDYRELIARVAADDAEASLQRKLGKFCVAEGELVLTDCGLVPIEKVSLDMRVWDGIEWVKHSGVVYQGQQPVMSYCGLSTTLKHKVFTESGESMHMITAAESRERLMQTGDEGRPLSYQAQRTYAAGVLNRATKVVATYDVTNAGPRNRYTVSNCLISNSNLSFQYRIGAKSATKKARVDYELDIEETTVKQLLATYKTTFIGVSGGPAGVGGYWKNQIYKCKQLGYAETFAGRRVQLRGSWAGRDAWEMESSAINYPIQGTGGDQKYLALAVARNLLPKYRGYFYYELHDGLFFIFPHAVARQAAETFKYVLSNLPYKKAWGLDLPITFPVDAKLSPESWGDLKNL